MAIISTEGIVLRTIEHRETSKIAFFFTRGHGKVKGVLKGIRKDPRKFGSSVDKFSVNDIVYYQYQHSDIHLISQCDMKEFFQPVREDIRRIHAAEYAAELVNKIMPVEEKNEAVFDLLLDYLRTLGQETDLGRLVHMFQIKILGLSGFRPHIDSCVACGKEITDRRERPRFSMAKGGLVCGRCQSGPRSWGSLISVSQGTIATLLYVEKHPWPVCLKLKMPVSIKQEMKRILNNFLVFHLEKNIKSAKFLS